MKKWHKQEVSNICALIAANMRSGPLPPVVPCPANVRENPRIARVTADPIHGLSIDGFIIPSYVVL